MEEENRAVEQSSSCTEERFILAQQSHI